MIRDTFIRLSEVQMEGVGKRWGDAWAVKDVSLSIRPGDFYTLLGPPRAGKTTLLKMLAGLIPPDAGRIVIDDQAVDRTPPSERNVGMVFQQNSVWPHLSIFENVAFGLRTRGEPANLVAGKVKAALAQVELEGIEAERPADLSRSQQQRVALARMLVMQPRLLLLDEPLSELDAGPRAEMRLWLSKFHRDVGITTIHASHDPAEALALSTRVAVIADGRVIQEGKPQEVYWRPRNRFVAEFVGAANVVPVRVVGGRPRALVSSTGSARAGGVRSGSVGHPRHRRGLRLRRLASAVRDRHRPRRAARGDGDLDAPWRRLQARGPGEGRGVVRDGDPHAGGKLPAALTPCWWYRDGGARHFRGGALMREDISPGELRTRLDQKQNLVLLDVRDEWETKLCRLEHSTHIPMEEIEFRTAELNPDDEIVVYCHHGVRSAAVANYLRGLGFAKAVNLAGGLDQWARTVDPTMKRY